jgi:dUTP pyrophosphatase
MNFHAESPDVAALYASRSTATDGNSGFDLMTPRPTLCLAGRVTFVDFGVQAMTRDGSGYFLLPRSSISKTPLRMANSVGLIDPTYRGNLIAALENISNDDFLLTTSSRVVQVALPSLMPFDVHWSEDKLPETQRGAGGFGSTGK